MSGVHTGTGRPVRTESSREGYDTRRLSRLLGTRFLRSEPRNLAQDVLLQCPDDRSGFQCHRDIEVLPENRQGCYCRLFYG